MHSHRPSIIRYCIDIRSLRLQFRAQSTVNMLAIPETRSCASNRLLHTTSCTIFEESHTAPPSSVLPESSLNLAVSTSHRSHLELSHSALVSAPEPITSDYSAASIHDTATSSSIDDQDSSVVVGGGESGHGHRCTASRTEKCKSANDAIAHGSPTRTNIHEEKEKEPLVHTNFNQDELRLRELLSRLKSPAQVEWEALWYQGLRASAKDLTCDRPETRITGQDLREPQLPLSELDKNERRIFIREDKLVRQQLGPTSELALQARVVHSFGADDNGTDLVLLSGLPTFAEYIAQKRSDSKTPVGNVAPEFSKSQLKRQIRIAIAKQRRRLAKHRKSNTTPLERTVELGDEGYFSSSGVSRHKAEIPTAKTTSTRRRGMSHEQLQTAFTLQPAQHRPLVVGLTKPQASRSASTMASPSDAAALNKEIPENVKENVSEAGPAEGNPDTTGAKQKKEKTPKPPKQAKAAPVVAPTSPALIDLRVGHILRAIAHPNADSLYVSTIAMGDAEGTDHTSIDEQTGKVVRTVCSGLNGLIPLEEMQDRKIIVVANLKPVNMRSIKSAAMVLAASPKQPEGADPHAPDRVVELVMPPPGSEAGDKVYFEGWPYGDGKGPEKQLNPKKKQWEAIQPGFYTGDDLVVGFNAAECPEVEGDAKGQLVVEGKGVCTVKTLKGAVVR